MRTFTILNGPNLNLLGVREPSLYGRDTLKDIEALCKKTAESLNCAIDFRQTNSEGELITWVQEAILNSSGLVINPGGYTHTSVALLDTLRAYPHKVIEVHLSNIHQREDFRHHSYVSKRADGVICGLGALGYRLALLALID